MSHLSDLQQRKVQAEEALKEICNYYESLKEPTHDDLQAVMDANELLTSIESDIRIEIAWIAIHPDEAEQDEASESQRQMSSDLRHGG